MRMGGDGRRWERGLGSVGCGFQRHPGAAAVPNLFFSGSGVLLWLRGTWLASL